MGFIKRLLCSHNYSYIGRCRLGDYVLMDTVANLFVCEDCGKIILKNKQAEECSDEKGIKTKSELLDGYYKNKQEELKWEKDF